MILNYWVVGSFAFLLFSLLPNTVLLSLTKKKHSITFLFHGNHCVIKILMYLQEGIKLLNTWLEGERSIGFCKYLGKNTAELIPDEIPHCMMKIYSRKMQFRSYYINNHWKSERKLFLLSLQLKPGLFSLICSFSALRWRYPQASDQSWYLQRLYG